jgi:hypothetical protein
LFAASFFFFFLRILMLVKVRPLEGDRISDLRFELLLPRLERRSYCSINASKGKGGCAGQGLLLSPFTICIGEGYKTRCAKSLSCDGLLGHNQLPQPPLYANDITTSIMSDGNVTVASNVLGTIGTVLWCIQLIPQIWYNYRRKKTDGFPAAMMLLWASCTFEKGQLHSP